jgi:hypothetical protein
MKFVQLPSASEQIRNLGWESQKSFLTPLKQLNQFVDAIVAVGDTQTAEITIEQVVFEPKEWISVLARYSLKPIYRDGTALTCSGELEVRELLTATFAGWIDFAYIPSPKRFVIYADHDEYTTFYASTKSNLNLISEAVANLGLKEAEYTRYL